MSDEKIFSETNFDEEVLKSDIPVLVDFWAKWCGPCKMMGPVVEKLAKEYSGRAKIGKVDIDQNQGLAGKYGIKGIPTIILFNKGEIVEQLVGAQSKDKLQELVNSSLS